MKKGKLLASIVSLCFSLAVLTFGVFAANQVNYAISGNISYVVSDAYVEVETKVYQSSAQPDSKQDLAVAAGQVQANGSVTGAVKTLQSGSTVTLNTVNTTPANPYAPVADPSFDFGSKFANDAVNYIRSFYVIVKITNLGQNNVYAVPSIMLHLASEENPTVNNAVDPATYNVVEYMSEGYSVIDQNETVYIKLAYTISEITSNIGNLKFTFGINIQAGDYPTASKNSNLKWDSTKGFWYVKMGTKTISSNTYDLRWRLYSIDGGATKYVDSEEYPIGRGVFVLEDAQKQNGTTIGSCLIGNVSSNQKVKFNEYFIDDGSKMYRSTDGSTFKSVTDDASIVHTKVLANDYFGSYMYEYLNTTYLGNTNTGANIPTGSGTLYNSIISRTQADLCQDMVAAGDVGGVEYQGIFNCEGISNGNNAVTRSAQKLWLLSYREALTIICGDEGVIWNPEEDYPYTAGAWEAGTGSGVGYWLRSPFAFEGDSYAELYVSLNGNCSRTQVGSSNAVRAAFQLEL